MDFYRIELVTLAVAEDHTVGAGYGSHSRGYLKEALETDDESAARKYQPIQPLLHTERAVPKGIAPVA